jgi:hypothetical protein
VGWLVVDGSAANISIVRFTRMVNKMITATRDFCQRVVLVQYLMTHNLLFYFASSTQGTPDGGGGMLLKNIGET